MPLWAKGEQDLNKRIVLHLHLRHFLKFFCFTPLSITVIIEFHYVELDRLILLFWLEKLPHLKDTNVDLVTVKINKRSALSDNYWEKAV